MTPTIVIENVTGIPNMSNADMAALAHEIHTNTPPAQIPAAIAAAFAEEATAA